MRVPLLKPSEKADNLAHYRRTEALCIAAKSSCLYTALLPMYGCRSSGPRPLIIQRKNSGDAHLSLGQRAGRLGVLRYL